MKVEISALTDVGRVRELNEDNYKTNPDKNLAVVCDGMGGHAAGEVASQIAVETISRVVSEPEQWGKYPAGFKIGPEFNASGKLLVHAIRLANRKIFTDSQKDRSMRGMGTTVVAVIIDDDYAIVCHVGDSRVYRYRNGNLQQLTEDHSWVNELISKNQLTEEESKNFVSKNVITRALGTRENVKVDIRQDRVVNDDIYLLCSDGLSGFVDDPDILKAIKNNSDDLGKICQDLIARANAAGGEDNITAAVLKVTEVQESGEFAKELNQATVDEESNEELTHEDNLLGSMAAPKAVGKPRDDVTKPIPIPQAPPKKKKSGGGWIFFSLILILLIVGYVGYSYNLFDFQNTVKDLIGKVTGKAETTAEAADVQTAGPVNIQFSGFPSGLLDDTLYLDMVLQGPIRQYYENKLVVEPGYHIFELKGEGSEVYARFSRTMKSGDILLTPEDFNLDE